LIEASGFKLLQQIQFPNLSAGLAKIIKPTSATIIGDDFVFFGLSKHQYIYMFRYDPADNKYVFVERSGSKSDNKSSSNKTNNSVMKLTVNTFNLTENFGVNTITKHSKDTCQLFYITKNSILYS
jgi:hypothetical protein